MMSNYGPPNWNAREEAKAGLEGLDLQGSVALGNKLWAQSSEEMCADNFWNVVAPLVHALAAGGAEGADFGDGFSAATACEQLMHEIALAYGIEEAK
jgi:hypothetical protein